MPTRLHTIKVDRSFIARLWPDDPSMVIVEGLIDIARKLDILVVAEGIETEVQASQLWTMGCKLGQGFAFSKAVDRHAIAGLLRRHGQADGALPLHTTKDAPQSARCEAAQGGVEELRPTSTG